jgi:hypothetical protein
VYAFFFFSKFLLKVKNMPLQALSVPPDLLPPSILLLNALPEAEYQYPLFLPAAAQMR